MIRNVPTAAFKRIPFLSLQKSRISCSIPLIVSRLSSTKCENKKIVRPIPDLNISATTKDKNHVEWKKLLDVLLTSNLVFQLVVAVQVIQLV